MQIVHNIDEYIKRLKKDYGLSVTLHPYGNEVLICESELIKYNFHESGYCVHLKTNRQCLQKCISKQEKIFEKLRSVPCFTGVCHAGVKEKIYGTYLQEELLGFISVSGYKAEERICAPRLDFVCSEFSFPQSDLRALYGELKEDFPDDELLDSLIFPLCRMLEYGNALLRQHANRAEGLYADILRYLYNGFTEDVTLESIAKTFFVSTSQISHTFKKNNGKSIREYLTFLRIQHAKNLLRYTKQSVTEIALDCGFSDCSYFCNQFKKEVGCTPNVYRANKQK